MIFKRKFEDKLTKELLKIVHYNLQTSIRLILFLKDFKVEQFFNPPDICSTRVQH